MKKLLLFCALLILASGCEKSSGELIGVGPRPEWFDIDPFGMLFIPMGSYNMGPDDEDVGESLGVHFVTFVVLESALYTQLQL